MTFDPVQWSALYESGEPAGAAFKFVRGSEIAKDLCMRLCRPHQHWLDVGCGTGHLAADLAAGGLSVVGVDRDPHMIAFGRQRSLRQGLSKGLAFVNADAVALPFGDQTIDGVLATSLAGCLSSVQKFFQEVHRVLCKNGSAIVTFTNRESLLLRADYALRSSGRGGREARADCESFQLYAAARVVRDLRAMGFGVENTLFYNFFLDRGRRIFPSKRIALYCERWSDHRLARRWARNFILVLRKRR
jgi:ubiquinone/menaquinone biosynthesis C-methylase UbiE